MAEWSGKLLYTEETVKKCAPTSGGVYLLEDSRVFYVGQSDNLERRLLEHLGSSEQNACIKRHIRDYTCYFYFTRISSQSDRDRIEQELISKYKPSCNEQGAL